MRSAVPMTRFDLPHLGHGLGLRTNHFQHILEQNPAVDWFEIISENFMGTGGRPMHVIDQIAERYPVVMHGVSLSIGSTDPIDFDYLRRLKRLAERVRPAWISDHVCWTGLAHHSSHDLLPVPYDDETLAHLIARVRVVQDFLERPLILENPSTYVELVGSTMTEWQFLAELAGAADCGLLLDVNNIYVSCFNHGWDVDAYLAGIPYERVVQLHLAGHTNYGTHIIDTHIGPIIDEVWALYRRVHALTGGRPTLIEWDDEIPAFEVVHAEALRARDQALAVDAAREAS
jgi:uncharacterized protein (UPF0276 family)